MLLRARDNNIQSFACIWLHKGNQNEFLKHPKINPKCQKTYFYQYHVLKIFLLNLMELLKTEMFAEETLKMLSIKRVNRYQKLNFY